MTNRFISQTELRARLRREGHELDPDPPLSTDVVPPPDFRLTVAANIDPTHVASSRERYFVTLLDRPDCKPLIRHHPHFALSAPFAAALDLEPAGGVERSGNFLLGPFRWLVHRLARSPRVLLWPENQLRASDGFVCEEWVGDAMPELRAWLGRLGADKAGTGAILLDTTEVADCRVIWELAGQVEAGVDNYFMADTAATEVYELHHHSKVIISIPDTARRAGLFKELSSYAELFERCPDSLFDSDDGSSSGRADLGHL